MCIEGWTVQVRYERNWRACGLRIVAYWRFHEHVHHARSMNSDNVGRLGGKPELS